MKWARNLSCAACLLMVFSIHFVVPVPPPPATDCFEIQQNQPGALTGVYTIYINAVPTSVRCDMTTDGGGWTVFQRRADPTVDFFVAWTPYAGGFGTAAGNHWLGNSRVAAMTAIKQYTLRIDLGDKNYNPAYAKYSNFKIGGAGVAFNLTSLGQYSGNATDAMAGHLGMRFSTAEIDNDNYPAINCATQRNGPWWHNACGKANLNGLYDSITPLSGVNWQDWHDNAYSLKFTEMKIRPS